MPAEYRGTNGFNAIVTESKAVAKDFRIVAWSRYCAGTSGRVIDVPSFVL